MRSLLRQAGQVSARVLSASALVLLMALEAFSSGPYQDIAGVWTNGFGNTINVGPTTPPISRDQAQHDLVRHVNVFATGIDNCLRVTPTQNQYDAVMLWTYNVGVTAACHSTLIRQLNEGALPSIWCKQLLKWNKVTIHGQLVPSRGLTNRRNTEYQLCMKDSHGKS
jgi:lysozyme